MILPVRNSPDTSACGQYGSFASKISIAADEVSINPFALGPVRVVVMKLVTFAARFTLLGLVLCTSGCITAETLDHAEGSKYTNDKGEVVVNEKSKPELYGLLPLTVPADIVTFPFQLLIGYLEVTGALPMRGPM